ncbi:hypothetical protein IHQ71_28450 [Rhizobium sp. TH2]|uniref:hypothetical protein n=1 Tax=Rhizobium sp. TH2 TaxID=2775403 RepID=UPI0021580673|nr:hypothetical protein [Rhizobium sp. TH2]UVC08995.1 hypothetical protein IHQ71_28450 [Rhizobium sp. TH2]
MVYRKGELSAAGIDRGWPYQVALPQEKCGSTNYDIHAEFNKCLSLCSRGHSVVFEDAWYNVFCYSLKEDAEAFMARFGGEWFDPRERGKGAKWMKWHKGELIGKAKPKFLTVPFVG